MYYSLVGGRSFFIDNEEIISLIGNNNIKFSILKEKNGDVVFTACKSGKGMTPFIGKNKVRFNIPSVLKKYKGERVLIYIERLRPLNGEVFRIRPISFSIDGYKTRETRYVPYSTESSIVIPQMYVNEVFYRNFSSGIALSFSKTAQNTIRNGYLMMYMADRNFVGKQYVDDYMLKRCGTGLRTNTVTETIEFLGRNGAKLTDYSYDSTLYNGEYEFGVIIFKDNRI